MANEEEDHSPGMPIMTYTNVWSTQKKLYAIYDMSLPAPLPLVSAGIFLVVGVIWAPIAFIVGIPLTHPMGLIAYLAPPVLAAIFANKPIFEGKSIFGYLASMLKYTQEPQALTQLRPDRKMDDETIHLEITAWVPEENIPGKSASLRNKKNKSKKKSARVA